MNKTKSYHIPKELVYRSYRQVKSKAGSAGADKISIEDYEKNLKNNLYKLWNRMSSGSYFPSPIKEVEIPKKKGGVRKLGIPTVEDRIAQGVVKIILEEELEKHFLSDSYGYRPNKSAIEAIGITRQRCWETDWVLEYDIIGLFDNIDHDLLLKALSCHTDEKWIHLYITRWLKIDKMGVSYEKTRGTPQGGVISPLLANLFLHYVFDKWMMNNYPSLKWCRFSDDGLIHCKTLKQAEFIKIMLSKRFNECGLELHNTKTKIVYCKDGDRKENHSETNFTFLGFTFRPRRIRLKGKIVMGFTPAVSKEAGKSMRNRLRKLKLHKRVDLELEEIGKIINPIVRGWLNYYGSYSRSSMKQNLRYVNLKLVSWARSKYKKVRSKTKASQLMQRLCKENRTLIAHWKEGIGCAFA